MHRELAVAVASVSLALGGCKRGDDEVHATKAVSLHVSTVEVTARRVPIALPATGTLEAERATELAANATGKVIVVHAAPGQEVKRGAPLAELDVKLSDLQANVAKAQVSVSTDQAGLQAEECARTDTLAKTGAIAPAERARMAWQCKIAEGGLAISRLQAEVAAKAVADGIVRAPFDGYVVERFVETGQFVMPASRIATIISLDPLKLRISVPERHFAGVVPGLQVTFRVGSYKDRVFYAKIVRVAPIVRTATRDVIAEAEVENPERLLRPGMFASVELPLTEATVPTISKTALVTRDGASHAFVLRNGRLEERAVQLGVHLGDDVAIDKGLVAGERVVVERSPEMKNGIAAN